MLQCKGRSAAVDNAQQQQRANTCNNSSSSSPKGVTIQEGIVIGRRGITIGRDRCQKVPHNQNCNAHQLGLSANAGCNSHHSQLPPFHGILQHHNRPTTNHSAAHKIANRSVTATTAAGSAPSGTPPPIPRRRRKVDAEEEEEKDKKERKNMQKHTDQIKTPKPSSDKADLPKTMTEKEALEARITEEGSQEELDDRGEDEEAAGGPDGGENNSESVSENLPRKHSNSFFSTQSPASSLTAGVSAPPALRDRGNGDISPKVRGGESEESVSGNGGDVRRRRGADDEASLRSKTSLHTSPVKTPKQEDAVFVDAVSNRNNSLVNNKKMATTKPPFLRSTTTMSSVDSDILEKQELADTGLDDGFVTQVDKEGNIEQVPVKYVDRIVTPVQDGQPNSMADFVSSDILTKPFNFVSGNVSKTRFNPFRKKSGLLNVLAKQSTRNRIVAKNGTLNTVSNAGTKTHHFLKDFFITVLDLGWMWIFFFFAAAFFSSWLLFALVWYLTFLQHGDFDPENLANETFVPCVSAIQDFTSCFLFSIETQHTIGYGGR